MTFDLKFTFKGLTVSLSMFLSKRNWILYCDFNNCGSILSFKKIYIMCSVKCFVWYGLLSSVLKQQLIELLIFILKVIVDMKLKNLHLLLLLLLPMFSCEEKESSSLLNALKLPLPEAVDLKTIIWYDQSLLGKFRGDHSMTKIWISKLLDKDLCIWR